MWRIPSERVRLDFDGPSVEVEPIRSWLVQFDCLRLAGAYLSAEGAQAEAAALLRVFDRFISEAQPTWDIGDHRGPIPNTAEGMVRLPLNLSLPMFNQWIETLPVAEEEPERPELPGLLHVVESDAPSAADAVLPAPLAREVNRRLRGKKKAA